MSTRSAAMATASMALPAHAAPYGDGDVSGPLHPPGVQGDNGRVSARDEIQSEGFDHPTLDTLLLALPVAWKGTLTQYAGRLSRAAAGKRDARIYDYADTRVPVLARMYAKRERVYRSLGYEFGASTEASHDGDPEGSATFMWAQPP